LLHHCGHGPLAPQQIAPHESPPIGPAAWQVSPDPHAAAMPHRHVPLWQCSPVLQQPVPHAGPVAQLPLGAQVRGAASISGQYAGVVQTSSPPHAASKSTSSHRMARWYRLVARVWRFVATAGKALARNDVTRFDRFYEPLLVVLIACIVLYGTL
jgi:hypothetical protein